MLDKFKGKALAVVLVTVMLSISVSPMIFNNQMDMQPQPQSQSGNYPSTIFGSLQQYAEEHGTTVDELTANWTADDWLRWYKYEGNPSWGSTNITDQFLATDWVKLPNSGNLTWGANYDYEYKYNATSDRLEMWHNGTLVSYLGSDDLWHYASDRPNLTDLHHIVDREYVDYAVASLGARYYMVGNSSGISDYKLTQLSPPSGSEDSVTKSGLADGDYIAGWISPNPNQPNKLIKGVYNWNIYAEKTGGTKTLRLYWELIERKSNGTENVIATSITSNEILNSKNSYIIPLVLSEDYTLDDGSYVVGKIYADVSGGGFSPSIAIYFNGTSKSHWEIPTNLEIFSDQFLKLDGSNANSDIDVSPYNITVGNISAFNLKLPASYIIWTDGTNYYALNGSTGEIDYSGTDAATVINNAIDNLSSTSQYGGKVFIKNGLYIITSTIKITDSIYLQGENIGAFEERGTVLKLADGANCDMIEFGLKNGSSHDYFGSISDLFLIGNSANQTNTSRGIVFTDLHSDAYIHHIYLKDFRDDAIYMANGYYNHISECWIEMTNSNGIRIIDSLQNFILDCTFYDNNGYAIYIDGGTTKISGNRIVTCADYGIYITGNSAGTRIIGNTVSETSGIYTATSKVIIDGNNIAHNTYGVYLYGSSNNIISNNIISSNTNGLYLASSNGNVFSSNEIILSDNRGVLLSNSLNNIFISNAINSNGDDGLYFLSSDNNVVSNNRFAGSTGYGIDISSSTSDNNLISYNTFSTNSLGAIYDLGTGTIIKGNVGYTTENSGSSEITGTGSDTSFTISHGLATTPSQVLVTPTNSSMASATWWVSAKSSTTFTITFSTAPSSGTKLSFDWYAEV